MAEQITEFHRGKERGVMDEFLEECDYCEACGSAFCEHGRCPYDHGNCEECREERKSRGNRFIETEATNEADAIIEAKRQLKECPSAIENGLITLFYWRDGKRYSEAFLPEYFED